MRITDWIQTICTVVTTLVSVATLIHDITHQHR
ncbi:hypothetical protein BBOMB_1046 [Bifidobacterium bombi DSM 19703]|uniref:Uncharacterized protein n=1 Tax=Bifidobacterium bombi DSM 19703 TaxID=1341695 RepID=A0A080N6I6_9BIFI|nr:hypothetical protein BBOMB_1046 [Bifidobacterium bombi DSM 19703]